jgi:glyoxylase-like metal-dependent hydrolase (beta-lactamase superfamily II)
VPAWICVRCGVQYPDAAAPPPSCRICEDEREAVPAEGQRWTHTAELGSDHRTEIRTEEPGLTGIGVTPAFGIGQRALLVRTAAGNVLWDCVPLLDEPARRAIDELGGLSAICLSHPHFYAAHLEFAAAFDAPVFLPRADEQWIPRNSPRIELFDDEIEPVPGLTVARIGGHFDGACVLHWPEGAQGRGALLTGDTIMVVEDRGWVSFMWSYPNLIPLPATEVERIAAALEPWRFDRILGAWWGRLVPRDGNEVVRRSAARYAARLAG